MEYTCIGLINSLCPIRNEGIMNRHDIIYCEYDEKVTAAGGKAAIALIEQGIIDKDHVKLLNTTSKDIPDKYISDQSLFIPFSSGIGGCGKESSKGRAYMIEAITNKSLNFAELINEDSSEVILVSSVEGGTGSGAVPVVAQYFDAMNIPTHVFAFIGFQDEARGINNTLKFFKDLPEKVILHTIVNSHFLDYTKNYSKAEMAANDEFVREVQILLGMKLVPSKQNIDEQDLYKINTQEGYMTIHHVLLENIKNVEAFNKLIADAFENSCSMDCDQSAKRIAVMINASRRTQDIIDNSFEVIKRYVGIPIELFQHIQPDNDDDLQGEEWIDIIACGMNYPEKPIRDISMKYSRLREKLNVGRKSLHDIFGDIEVQDELDEFNMDVRKKLDQSKADALFSQQIGSQFVRVGRSKSVDQVEEDTPVVQSQATPSKDNRFENVDVEPVTYELKEVDDEDDDFDQPLDIMPPATVASRSINIDQALSAAAIKNPMRKY